MKRATLALAALAVTQHTLAVEPLTLKGYSIGQPMTQCPAGTVSELPYQAGVIICNLGATTLANQPATAFSVMHTEGAIATVLVRMRDRGRDANYQVQQALHERYGPPSESKPHVNYYRWQQGSLVLIFDGWAGTVALGDSVATRRRLQEQAKKGAGDL